MKKVLSIILAVMMAVSVFAVSFVPAMAADTVASPTAGPAVKEDPSLTVNGLASDGTISFTENASRPYSYTFTYTGTGELIGWENNLEDLGLVEGVDYTAVMNEDGTYTITFLTEEAEQYFHSDKLVVNAIVDLGDGTGTTDVTAKPTTTSKNDSSKAPATGMSSSVVAGSVAVACAGVAVLAATKKKFSK